MFNYFGSKSRLAPTYQPPGYETIVEPFAGAAGYSMYWLQQRSDLRAVLHDTDILVCEMWATLLALNPAQLARYPLPEPGRRSTDAVYLAAGTMGGSWIRRSRGDDFAITPWIARDFATKRETMAHTLARVRGRVEIRHSDYSDAQDVEATWFIDPPYQREGHWYGSGNRLDFAALGEWSRSRSGQVIVCETYGADWMDFQPHVTNQTVSNSSSVEAVWYSHPEPTLFTYADHG